MNWFQRLIAYYKDNPEGYWFKRKLYGWGWMPVKWQGWLVVAVAVAIIALGFYIVGTDSSPDDAPGIALIGILTAVVLLFTFGYWKGEKPKWQWGLPKKEKPKTEDLVRR